MKISGPTQDEEFKWSVLELLILNLLQTDIKRKINYQYKSTSVKLKIESGYYLKHVTPYTIKLLENTKEKIPKGNNDENFPLEIIEVTLIPCNFVYNTYPPDLRVLHPFIPN